MTRQLRGWSCPTPILIRWLRTPLRGPLVPPATAWRCRCSRGGRPKDGRCATRIPAAGDPQLRVGTASDIGAQMGPVVTGEHKRKVESYIQMAIDEGADVVIDGRGIGLTDCEKGFFLWPTLSIKRQRR
ncbi:aldehyde dehydrogenase family protein [Rhizobium ruizarguesonis]|uniref:aldehyde dehydrogenase family protein n=1 Tax=Rhizobium ruizarguesonis TaxID=2081791 RepID=UPI00247B0BC0|nr:aldehyde dehydrogenase family protein [Rhizobium ruizarguesonis]